MSAISKLLPAGGIFRIGIILAVLAAFGLLIVFVIERMTTVPMSLLFGELETSDTSQIASRLDALGVPYEISGNGTQILVPRDQVLRLRMRVAEESLPRGGSIGYEIFDKPDSFGTSSFAQNVKMMRALEGELVRTIRSLSGVKSARVHIVMPRRELFSRDKVEPTASVVIKPANAGSFSKKEVGAIQHLVASAVPGLLPARVSVVDDRGRLLARGVGDDGKGGVDTGAADDLKSAFEVNLARAIETLLEESIGPGQAHVRVSAQLDFDRVQTTTEKFDPDGQVVRSTQTVSENNDSREAAASQAVTVGNNLPNAQQPSANDSSSARSARNEETINYEITKTITNHIKEFGTVKRLSVAVLINGAYSNASGGQRTYRPRTEEEMANFARLVRSAVGFDEARGDTLELVNLQFSGGPPPEASEDDGPLVGLSKNDYFRIAEIFVIVIVTLLVILLVIRPLVTRIVASIPVASANDGSDQALIEDHSAAIPPQIGPPVSAVAQPQPAEDMIDLAQVSGRIRAGTVKKVGQIVDKHPEESLAILRKWLYQES